MLDAIFNTNGLIYLLAFITIFQLIFWLWSSRKTRNRKSMRDQELQDIIAKMTPAALDSIKATIRAGHKIEAIKILREATGEGLLEAKHCVEKLSADMSVR